MNQPIKYLLHLIASVVFALPLAACALSGKAIEGQVLDRDTNKPIPNSIVIARWSGHLATFAHGKTVCYHVLSTTTDENGIYRFAAWKKEITEDWQKNIQPEAVIITVHKPGYEEDRPPGFARTKEFKQNIRYLKPFTGAREEKLKYIERIKQSTVSCADPRANGQNLIPLYRALYEEAKPLAQTRDEQSIADGFLSWIKILEHESGK